MKGNRHMENVAQKNEKSIPGAIKIDEKEVFDHLDTLVRQSVEETINFKKYYHIHHGAK